MYAKVAALHILVQEWESCTRKIDLMNLWEILTVCDGGSFTSGDGIHFHVHLNAAGVLKEAGMLTHGQHLIQTSNLVISYYLASSREWKFAGSAFL